jgi:N-acetylmuramoyl-L-alanine amidase
MKQLAAATILAITSLVLAGSVAIAADPGGSRTYVVRSGDTLWSIGKRTGTDPNLLAARNHITNPRRLMPGQHLRLDDPPATASKLENVSGAAARRLLVAAAEEFGLNPNLVKAVALWESGYNQVEISRDGAIGLMQILPLTADWAGPALLGRAVDIFRAIDNARLGAALLRRYLDKFVDPKLALAAYYQGEKATQTHGIFTSSRDYVEGIWALRNLLQRAG